ncbi:MAG TPA: LysE family translocator [Accumulibacter sp.]|uniref:LysE family translocator n=1 Tax=Accumulibacter sp. TaxID=2053492 RepID=UPI0025D6871C|nr:LysE family translocator [Accumulibacter sp.]MCM8600022.1 LysE family translocator [Accumulibacter sp.]MCM8664209.1 LysE family translocator [Accumulibacter sp.]HNC53166.1 LysE family translocator [Accumulibacter sp.]
MFGTHDLALFLVSGVLLNLTPGADSLYIASRSIGQGARAGVVAALGIVLGCCVHVLAAALGLSVLLTASGTLFTLIKLVGAAYLIYIGFSLALVRGSLAPSSGSVSVAPLRSVFLQGLLTNVLNPKVALFFLAFLPQFIEPSSPDKMLAFVFLGAIFNFTTTLWCLVLAYGSARFRSLRLSRRTTNWLNRSVGALFVLLGVRLALTKQG